MLVNVLVTIVGHATRDSSVMSPRDKLAFGHIYYIHIHETEMCLEQFQLRNFKFGHPNGKDFAVSPVSLLLAWNLFGVLPL